MSKEICGKHEELSNEQLVIRIKAGIDVADNMLQLWQQNQKFITKMAYKYDGYENIEDLQQEGYIGLCHAVDGYNPEEGVPFINYAAFWFKQVMQRYIENCGTAVRIPIQAQAKVRKYRKFCDEFEKHYARKPTPNEIYRYTGLSEESIKKLEKTARMGQMGSLDSPLKGDEDGELTVVDTVMGKENVEDTILDRVQRQQLKETLWGLVDTLPEEQSQVVKKRYREGLALKDIATEMNYTYQQAAQLQRKGLGMLRHPSRSNKLRPFLYDDGTYSRAIKGCGVERFNNTWTSSTEFAALWDE